MFESITEQIIEKYAPEKILLFGSHAKNKAKDKSDIDLCIVMETNNKRQLLAELYYTIQSEKPIDIILYTPAEWNECIKDSTSFAYKIQKEGILLYG